MAIGTPVAGLTAGVVTGLANTSGAITFTLNTKPTSTNDSLVVTIYGAHAGTVSVSGGGGTWTVQSAYNDSGDGAQAAVVTKQATATDVSGATYTIQYSVAAQVASIYSVMIVPGGTFDAVSAAKGSVVASGTADALNSSALAPASNADLFVASVVTGPSTTPGTVTFSVPTSYTALETFADNSNGSLYQWYRQKSADTTAESPSSTPTYTGSLKSLLMSSVLAFKPTVTTGPLTLSTSSIAFNSSNPSANTFTASETSYTGPFTATSSATTVATVSGSGNGPGPITFTVTPVAAGSATITVTDNQGGSQTVAVTVDTSLVVTSTTSNYSSGGTFTVGEAAFTGNFTCTSSNTAVCTVTGTIPGPSGTGTITPVGPGNSTITVSDGTHSTTFVASVTGPLTVSTSSLSFAAGGSAKTFTVSESNYDGAYTITSSDTTVCSVSQSTTSPGNVTVSVTPTGGGSANITVTDDHGGSQAVSVVVVGPLTVSGVDTFTTPTLAWSVTDPGNTGTITATVNDTSKVTISPANGTGAGPISFTLTGVATGSTYVTFADGINTVVKTVTYTAPASGGGGGGGGGGSSGGTVAPGAPATLLTSVPAPPKLALALIQPKQPTPQSVEIALSQYGGRLQFAPNGDLALKVDTTDSADASRQRLECMLMLSPTMQDVDGVSIGSPDDWFNPHYGAGLPRAIGQANVPTLVNGIRSRILLALAADPEIAQTPAPTVTVIQVDNVTVEFSVSCYTVAGLSVTYPPQQLKTGG